MRLIPGKSCSAMKASTLTFLASALLFSAVSSFSQQANAGPANPYWTITKTEWTQTDERNYSAFIQALGESGCRTVDQCLKSPANPYRQTDDPKTKFWSDCGRFPYLMRAYFAWKNNLPFSVVSSVKAVDGLGTDLRYSPKGNYVTARKDIVQTTAKPIVGLEALKSVMDSIYTAVYRYNAENDKPNDLFFDLAPARIERKEVRPGTLIYDANGHVAVVYKVETDGRVRFFDAHPDFSVTRSVYGEKFARSSPNSGAGFKNFRPIFLKGATRGAGNALVGGKVTTIPFPQQAGFSMEQYYGTNPPADKNWKKAVFVINGQQLPYYDWVRTRLAVGDLKYKPVEEMLNAMDTLCSDIKDRVSAIDDAVARGIHQKAQPLQLPDNIYGTSGEWESYSTPSRDARLKTSFLELRKEVQKYVELYNQGSPRVVYNGTNLPADLRDAYERAASTCAITYKRSDASPVTLTYNDVVARLFSLSFDPYHCPELRWGASETSELVTCRDGSVKRNWFDAEQGLRNQLERAYDIKMGFTLEQLRAKVPGTGVATAPDVDVRKYLNSL
jgi:hypothetical protein